jgi:nitroreductase
MGWDRTLRRRGVELGICSEGAAVAVASLSSFLLFAEVVGEYSVWIAGLEADATDDAMARPEILRLLMSMLKDSSSTLARLGSNE